MALAAEKVLECIYAWLKPWGDTSSALLRAVLLNQAEEVERLLAQGVPLLRSRWPGKFTALHAAAISNCWRALPALLAAAAKEGLSIHSRLEPLPLTVILSEVHSELGLSGEESAPGICKEEQAEVPKRITGLTPLHLACWQGSLEVIPILLAHGASATLTSERDTWFTRTEDNVIGLLLSGKSSTTMAGLLPTVKLLVKHDANPLPQGVGWHWRHSSLYRDAQKSFYRGAGEDSLDIRRCLVRCIKKQHQQRQLRVTTEGDLLALAYGAAACSYNDALVYFIPKASRHRGHPEGYEQSIPGRWLLRNHVDLRDVLERLSPALTAPVLAELEAQGVRAQCFLRLLESAIHDCGPHVVKALVPYIGGPQTYTSVVDLSNPKETRPLGPCLVLNVIAGIPDGALHFKSVWGESRWQERAAAVLAYLTKAGFKPSIYLVARFRVQVEGGPDIAQFVRNYDPLAEHPQLLQNLPRPALLALQRPAWNPSNHRDFPPAFRAAVRASLLASSAAVQRRQQQQRHQEAQPGAGVQQTEGGLGDLPVPLLERVLGMAAYPLSAWTAEHVCMYG